MRWVLKKIAPMKPEDVLKGLKTRSFGQNLLCLERTTSTNDVVAELARQGAPEGTVVAAETQTKGRGRHGRRWVSTPGKSLAFSLLLPTNLHADEFPEITLAASVAVSKTLEDFHFKPLIKWPNDVLLEGRKVCGILTERGFKKDRMATVVLGIGINLNQSARDFPRELRETATSLYLVSGRKADRVRLFQKILFHLEEIYHRVAERRFSKVLPEWRLRAATLGCQVKVIQGQHVFYGQAIDADEKGALLVRNDLGIVERVTSGDVQILQL